MLLQVLLALALVTTLGQALDLFQRGWRLHGPWIALHLPLAVYLAAQLRASPGSGGPLFGLGLFVLLVPLPALLGKLTGACLAAGRPGLAVLPASLRLVLCWSRAARIERALCVALAGRPADPATAIEPVLQGLSDEERAWLLGDSAKQQPDEPRTPSRLAHAGPPVVTWALLAANLLAFGLARWDGLLQRHGLHDGEPQRVLVVFGALVEGLVREGERWRLVTAQFLHHDWLHLLLNGLALLSLGALTERLYGRGKLFVLYLAAGLCASLASLHFGRHGIAAGASGALCGLLGLLIAALLRRGGALPDLPRRRLLARLVLMAGAVGLIGALLPFIDQAAHAGGGLAGFLLGWLAYPEGLRERTPLRVRLVLLALVPAGLAALGWSAVEAARNVRGAGYPRRLPAVVRRDVPGTRLSVELPRFWVGALRETVPGSLAYREPWGPGAALFWVVVREEGDAQELAAQMREALAGRGFAPATIEVRGSVRDDGQVVGLAWVAPDRTAYGPLMLRISYSLAERR